MEDLGRAKMREQLQSNRYRLNRPPLAFRSLAYGEENPIGALPHIQWVIFACINLSS